MRSNGGRRAVLARLEPHQASARTANRLLWDFIAARLPQCRTWGGGFTAVEQGRTLPIVRVFGNRYALSGDPVSDGWLYTVPLTPASRPVLQVSDGQLYRVAHEAGAFIAGKGKAIAEWTAIEWNEENVDEQRTAPRTARRTARSDRDRAPASRSAAAAAAVPAKSDRV